MAEVQGQDNRESDPTALAAEATATGGGVIPPEKSSV